MTELNNLIFISYILLATVVISSPLLQSSFLTRSILYVEASDPQTGIGTVATGILFMGRGFEPDIDFGI